MLLEMVLFWMKMFSYKWGLSCQQNYLIQKALFEAIFSLQPFVQLMKESAVKLKESL